MYHGSTQPTSGFVTCAEDAEHCTQCAARGALIVAWLLQPTATFAQDANAPQGAATCAKYLADKLPNVPERMPADGSGAYRAKICAELERLNVRQPGLVELVARGVAFHHGGLCPDPDPDPDLTSYSCPLPNKSVCQRRHTDAVGLTARFMPTAAAVITLL